MKANRRKPSQVLTKILASMSGEERRRVRDRMLIAVKIAGALETKGLSNKAFAKLMGKSESEVSEWLSGNRNFTIDTLSDIGECLGIRLLPGTDIRDQRVSCAEASKRVGSAQVAKPYSMVGTKRMSMTACEWSVLENNAIAIA